MCIFARFGVFPEETPSDDFSAAFVLRSPVFEEH